MVFNLDRIWPAYEPIVNLNEWIDQVLVVIQIEHPELFLWWLKTAKFWSVFHLFAAVNSPKSISYFIIVSFKIITNNKMGFQ